MFFFSILARLSIITCFSREIFLNHCFGSLTIGTISLTSPILTSSTTPSFLWILFSMNQPSFLFFSVLDGEDKDRHRHEFDIRLSFFFSFFFWIGNRTFIMFWQFGQKRRHLYYGFGPLLALLWFFVFISPSTIFGGIIGQIVFSKIPQGKNKSRTKFIAWQKKIIVERVILLFVKFVKL